MTQRNISGGFPVTIDGEEYETVCDFGVIEKLERRILNCSIFEALHNAMNGAIRFSDVVDVMHTGMLAAKDTRLNRADLGKKLHKSGFQNYVEWYVSFLTYALTGDSEPETESVSSEELDKKKSE